MTPPMKTSAAGRKFIADHEGTVMKVYLDPVGIKTAGKGHTGKDLDKLAVGSKVSKAQVDRWFDADIAEAENMINKHVKIELPQPCFDALVAFALNVGYGSKGLKDGLVSLKSGRPSTMLTLINLNKLEEASAEFPKWSSATQNGVRKKLPGLVRRRLEEQAMFLSGLSEEEHETNVEADQQEKPKALAKEPAVQGATAIGAAALISEQADKIGSLAPYSSIVLYVFIGLVVLGIIYQLRKS